MAWHENEWIGELEWGKYAGVLRPPSGLLAGRDEAGKVASAQLTASFTLRGAVQA